VHRTQAHGKPVTGGWDPGGRRSHTPTREGAVLLSPADAARIANVSRDTIYREVQRGALPAKHVGRQLRIDPVDFRFYLRERGQG